MAALVNGTLRTLRNAMRANDADVCNAKLSQQWLAGLVGNLLLALDYPQARTSSRRRRSLSARIASSGRTIIRN